MRKECAIIVITYSEDRLKWPQHAHTQTDNTIVRANALIAIKKNSIKLGNRINDIAGKLIQYKLLIN